MSDKTKQEPAMVEIAVTTAGIDRKLMPSGDVGKDISAKEEDTGSKSKPDDWEEAAEISSPNLKGWEKIEEKHVSESIDKENYNRDFLVAFSDQYKDLPPGCEIDIADYIRSKNPCAQPIGQNVSGVLSGSIHSPASPGGMSSLSVDADSRRRANSVQEDLIPSPHTAMVSLHKTEKRYEVGKVFHKEVAKQRQLKAILNKLRPHNFEKLSMQFKETGIDNVVTLSGVACQIFYKALMEPTLSEMYAGFCSHLAGALSPIVEDNVTFTFKRCLLNICQMEFERGGREQAEADKSEEDGVAKETEEEREEQRLKSRRRMLGNIRLIGELYKKKMLTQRIMHECIKTLLGQFDDPAEEDLEALCELMSTIGYIIDNPMAKVHMDAYFDRMEKLSANQKISSRVRFMLRHTIDLRKNNWRRQRKVERPKKIDVVYREAAQDRLAQSWRTGCSSSSMDSSARRRP